LAAAGAEQVVEKVAQIFGAEKFQYWHHSLEILAAIFVSSTGAGKTTYLLSTSFRYGNGYIWQAILT
jgi:hypothetical protein